MELEDFQPLVDDTFVADFGADGTLELTLVEAADVPTGNDHDTAFSLLFRGPMDPVFQQSLVPLVHESFGSAELFLVAVGEDESGRLYEAVFTRLAG